MMGLMYRYEADSLNFSLLNHGKAPKALGAPPGRQMKPKRGEARHLILTVQANGAAADLTGADLGF